MAREVTKTQIDRLGDRLRKGDISEADLRLLNLYRRSFSDAYKFVVGTIRKGRKMRFLIEYDRQRGQLVTFRIFEDAEKQKAEDTRLEMELELNRLGVKNEVVLLDAASEGDVRRTHRRYFESLDALANSLIQ